MDRIRLLPDIVANQIAAGEVVGRPASVVKELMENAVDAGSNSVTVSFRDGGKELIMVVDNGCGMSESDARMAFERHATSKISSAEDLFKLRSFGFRGEALPSIASVSELEIATKTADSELGTCVIINGGAFVDKEYVQCPQGTRLSVRNLFYNTPARRRFLKDSSVEARHIVAEFQRVALCHADVAFTLYNNDILVYQLPSTNLRQRIVGVHGKSISGNLLDVTAETSIFSIEGFVGQPSAAKKINKEQYLFVNGRYFRSPYFHKAVMQAYEKLVATDTQPSYFLYLTIDPDRIDVNVHPQKTEIKFDDEQAMWQIINAAVRESLGRYGVVPMMDFEIDSSIDIPVFKQRESYKIPDIGVNPAFNPFDDGDRKTSYADAFSDSATIEYDSSVVEFISGEDTYQSKLDIDFEPVKYSITRLNDRYAVMLGGDGVMVADITRAHYRVLFERYRRLLGNNSSVSQQLLFPESVELAGDDYTMLSEMDDELSSLGFDLKFAGSGIIEVMGVPSDLSPAMVVESLEEIASYVKENGELSQRDRIDNMAAIMSRRIALSSGVRMGNDALQVLFEELLSCEEFSYTPSGQNIITNITPFEIEQRLK